MWREISPDKKKKKKKLKKKSITFDVIVGCVRETPYINTKSAWDV